MNMQQMMAEAKKMEAKMKKAQEELNSKEFYIEKQGIKVTILGNKQIKSIAIDEILVDPEDKELLEDLMLITINEAIRVVEKAEDEIKSQQGLSF